MLQLQTIKPRGIGLFHIKVVEVIIQSVDDSNAEGSDIKT